MRLFNKHLNFINLYSWYRIPFKNKQNLIYFKNNHPLRKQSTTEGGNSIGAAAIAGVSHSSKVQDYQYIKNRIRLTLILR